MKPATWARDDAMDERLLVIDPRASRFDGGRVRDLVRFVRAGDVIVVNDAATLPASIHGSIRVEPVELRLLSEHDGAWDALLFGSGDWRTPTENRPAPPLLSMGDVIRIGEELAAVVVDTSTISPRLATLRFDREGAALWSQIYKHGHPIQYAYVERPFALWDVQTAYASRPWSSEMPSAGRPLTWEMLLAMRKRGATLASITHAAGISSTGDAKLDALLPMRERYEIPEATVNAIHAAKVRGGRVIAVGTSVVRALEGCAEAHGGALEAGAGETEMLVHAGQRMRIVDGLFTGMHERSASHFDLLQAFTPLPLLDRAYAFAERAGFLCHELGDSALLLGGSLCGN